MNHPDMPLLKPLTRNRRQRAAEMEERMLKHPRIYNSAAQLRDSWYGSAARREQCARTMAEAVRLALQPPECDAEAVLYAVADSLYCSPLGVPWEA